MIVLAHISNGIPVWGLCRFNLYRFSFNDAPNWSDYLGLINLTLSGNRESGSESTYLNDPAIPIFGGEEGDRFTNIGSERSRNRVTRTGGLAGHIDANRRGREMSGLLCDSDEKEHNVLAHSAGVYNAVEGITKFAKDCCCGKGGVTINLLLIAPKIAARIIRRKLLRAMEECPGLKLNIRLYFDSRDSDIPRHGWPVNHGEWEEDVLVTPEEEQAGTGPFNSFAEEEISQPADRGEDGVHGFTAALGMSLSDGGTETQQRRQRRIVRNFLNPKR